MGRDAKLSAQLGIGALTSRFKRLDGIFPLAELRLPDDFTDPKHFMALAGRHLERVQEAWSEPDWSDLSTYGLYCLEALVRAAQLHLGRTPSNSIGKRPKRRSAFTRTTTCPTSGN
jgi:hypothetical protein